mgnify:CR=1 FL=1
MTNTPDDATLPSVSEESRALYSATLKKHEELKSLRQRGIFERDQGMKDAKRIEEEVQARFGMSIADVPAFIRSAVPQNEADIARFAQEVADAERVIKEINAHRAAS